MAVWYSTTDCTYVAANQFSVTGDLTTQFPATIRVRVSCSGVWKYASVSSSSYGGVTTVVTLDASVLTNPASSCEVGGAITGDEGSLPDHDHSASGAGGSGVTGTAPAHEISGSNIRFRKPNLDWGDWFDISGGPKGLQGDQGVQGAQGYQGSDGSGGGSSNDIPAIIYKDADEITVPAGTYYSQGHRIKGQYQVTDGLESWVVSSNTDVDLQDEVVGGLTSGTSGGWYCLFMLGASSFVFLPMVVVYAISESGGVTTINPGDHGGNGAAANNAFVNANDVFNDYRLVYLGDWNDTNHGTIYTISDTVDSTPDEIKVASDITGVVSTKDWFQMIPPSGIDYLYLGVVRYNTYNYLDAFLRNGWRTDWTEFGGYINGVTNLTQNDTNVTEYIPPLATFAILNPYISGSSTDYVKIYFYSFTSAVIYEGEWACEENGTITVRDQVTIPLWQRGTIRNRFIKEDGGGVAAANTGRIYVCGWIE